MLTNIFTTRLTKMDDGPCAIASIDDSITVILYAGTSAKNENENEKTLVA